MSTIYANKRPTSVMQLTKREVMLKRYFKIAINRGYCNTKQYHDFCKWAKNKSESFILSHLK